MKKHIIENKVRQGGMRNLILYLNENKYNKYYILIYYSKIYFNIFSIKYFTNFQISGREMFSFNPELAAADLYEDGDEAFEAYNLEDDDDDANNIQVKSITTDSKIVY